MKLSNAVDCYLGDCLAREQSLRTIDSKRSVLRQFTVFCTRQDIARIANITDLTLEAYRKFLITYKTSRNKPLDATTRANKLTIVRVFIRRLYQLHMLDSNPAERFILPKRPRKLPDSILVNKELDAIFNQTAIHGLIGQRDRLIMETYYSSAIRRAELAQLTLHDINYEHCLLRVTQGKGRKDRIIPIAPQTLDSIATYISEIRPKLASFEAGDRLFLDNKGHSFKPGQLSALVRKYVMRAGVNRKGACNLFRHTAATAMLDNGADIRIIQEQLGHADISTTQVYTRISNKLLKDTYMKTHPMAKL